MSARVWSSEPAKLAKRRGIACMVGFAVLLIVVAGTAPLWGMSPTFAVLGIVTLVIAVLWFVVGAIAFSISRRYPAVRHLGGPNDLVTILGIVVGAAGVVLEIVSLIGQPAEYVVSGVVLAVMIAVFAGSVLILSAANRTAIRSEAATGPRG
ncbi:hypothetical protein WJX64_12495 [Leifsonia sp. YIM 134122]|uniref:Uncharacterized protein n=1 Tax=Leifsonia stereocauli TaxID=3134136 RepID=A0ABU9W5T8_9MICO